MEKGLTALDTSKMTSNKNEHQPALSWVPVVKRLRSLTCNHLAPHRKGSRPGRGKNVHVVLPIHADILIFLGVRSSSKSNCWKSPYDSEGVDATQKPKK